jgi:hypothetical protein
MAWQKEKNQLERVGIIMVPPFLFAVSSDPQRRFVPPLRIVGEGCENGRSGRSAAPPMFRSRPKDANVKLSRKR